MHDYRNFEPEDLAADPLFQRWKLVNDPEAGAFWKAWLVQNPDKKELVDKAGYLLHKLDELVDQSLLERLQISEDEIKEEIQRLHGSLGENQRGDSGRWFVNRWPYGIAASVLLLLGVFGWAVIDRPTEKKPVTYQELVAQAADPLTEVINNGTEPMRVKLPDGSAIRLHPKSQVSYANPFSANKREVYLAGEAFFEVAKDPTKPFYVYANRLVTKVLGTSFTVQAYEGARQARVVVRTGKVSVFARNQEAAADQKEDYTLGGIVLTPNQQLVLSAEERRLVKSLVESPALLERPDQPEAFSFKRTPMAEVFHTLEQAYGVRIVYDEELMKDCYLTAALADEPLFEKLDLICRTINASYEQLDAHIIISSKGCR
jgi:transmembrane sensor